MTELEITPLLPPSSGAFDFESLECVPAGPEISIVEDYELSTTNPTSVIEIGTKSSVLFYASSSRPQLVVHFKSIKKFFTFIVKCTDGTF